MPVYLEHITQPTESDWIDLEKIYTKSPKKWLVENDNSWFIAGRFNSRLLGAVLAEKTANNITLNYFCVREITRNRGVAHQMLHHINRWADNNGYTIIIQDLPESLSDNLIKRGFLQEGNNTIRTPTLIG